jgi:predicted transcriptional regulator
MAERMTANAAEYTDEDIERWGAEAEAGFPGWKFGKSVAGRPISVGAEAKPFTLRLDAERRAKLNEIAQERHTTPSQLMRDLIDAL